MLSKIQIWTMISFQKLLTLFYQSTRNNFLEVFFQISNIYKKHLAHIVPRLIVQNNLIKLSCFGIKITKLLYQDMVGTFCIKDLKPGKLCRRLSVVL